MTLVPNSRPWDSCTTGGTTRRVVNVRPCQDDNDDPVQVEFAESGVPLIDYSESNSVAGLDTVTLINFTVPVGKKVDLERIDYSGENIVVLELEVNATTIEKHRTYYTEFDDQFILNGELAAGDNLKLIVENKTNLTMDINATLKGRLIDA